ncbi:hypothetical protein OS493_021231 [Desmophyllum pertusum]|uniref:Uncharacterized protein n=1 Tax=Desmophyllum pertusum TaxID=174260 RepID=A0A9X0D4J4_9CNID|nr:hypothetical protein OS493_021231 [Desmophyllum pertusum]
MAPLLPSSQRYFKSPRAENNNRKTRDFDPRSKPQSANYMTRFASNNTGLLCLFGILVLPILLGFALGYLFIILGVSAYKKLTGQRSREKAAKEALQKIQVVMGDKLVDSSFPKTVSLNVQETKNRSFSSCSPTTRYYYHRLCNYSNVVVNGDANTYRDDESSVSGEETDNRSREKLTVRARMLTTLTLVRMRHSRTTWIRPKKRC